MMRPCFRRLVWCVLCGGLARGFVASSRRRDARRPLSATPLCLQEIAAKWLIAAQNGCTLESKNTTFVDERFEIDVPRSGGLGLVLEELYAQADGRGVVLVEGVVEGSNADLARSGAGYRIERGDTLLSAVSDAGDEVFLEGRSYDETVTALGWLGDAETATFKVQRLVPRAQVAVTVLDCDGSKRCEFNIASGGNLRSAFMINKIKDSEVYDPKTLRFDAIGNSGSNCGGEGTCGTCLIAIETGQELLSEPARVERQVLAKQRRPNRWRWACRLTVGMNNQAGEVVVRLRPQSDFADEQAKITGV